MRFSDYFADEQIISWLCKARIKQAGRRRNARYVRRMTVEAPPQIIPSGLEQLLPPRRQWTRFRPDRRGPNSATPVDLIALKKAALTLREEQPNAQWAEGLRLFIGRVRERALVTNPFVFTPPSVIGELKEEHKYRAICRFPLEDNLIISLTAKYLRELVDPALDSSSFAFRARSPLGTIPNHHGAFERLHQLKTESPLRRWHVAECDISGFFDTVDHQVALQSLDRVVAGLRERNPRAPLDSRAREIFQAYLACYSFPQNVLGEAENELKRRYPAACFPWPEGKLKEFHCDPRGARIGVPQGGALSCVIANLVLDYADRQIRAVHPKVPA